MTGRAYNHEHLSTDGAGGVAAQPCTDPACPVRWCSHGPDERCFDCATDGDLAAAIPDWPAPEAVRMAPEDRKD
jgi:hypothetical protein